MRARSSFFGWPAVLLATALLTLTFVPAAKAQYSIPDCMVAGLNNLMNDQNYYAGRDVSYKEVSSEWSTYTAGLTPAQLEGYTAYVCAHLVVVDLGKDAEETWHWRLDYPLIEDYLATIGQQVGGNGGGSGNSGAGNGSPNGSTDKPNSAPPADIAVVAPADVLFDTDFDDLPPEIELYDENNDPIDGGIATVNGNTVLHIEADGTRSLYLTGADDWTDYAIEARIKVEDGSLLLSTRTADDYCSSYDFYVEPAKHYGSVQASDSDCKSTMLQDRRDLSIKPGEWTTLRLESAGNQISASIDGEPALSATDDSYSKGFPALILFPDGGKTATLDVDSLQIIAVHPAPQALTDYAGTPAEAIAELQALGQLPSGKNTLIFQQKTAYASGSGVHYYLMAARSPRTDVVMAATLTLKSASSTDIEACELLARITSEPKLVSFGFDNQGYLFFGESSASGNGDRYINSSDAPYPPGQSYHLLVTLIGERAVVYVDGVRAMVVDQVDVHAGTYALVLVGANGNSRCDASNYWAYSFK